MQCAHRHRCPLVSRPVEINGKLYLDGGLADSIPLLHAVTDGCRKNVVVMTKETGYRRVQPKHLELIKARYAEISEGIRADGKPRSSL